MGIINRNSKAITVFSLPWPLQSAYFFPQQYRFSPFPGLYDYLIFLRKNTGFLPSLAFTNSLFFSAGLTVFSLPWPLQTAYLAPIFAENRSKSENVKEF
tara:strand:- start:127 stop:423 length:297 start_codon:yes stop_codon:yes gene_type:complete